MTDRIIKMKEALKVDKYPLCVSKIKIACDTLNATLGKDMVTRRAMIQKNILEQVPIFIMEDDLIAGEGASEPNGTEMEYEFGVWSKEEIDSVLETGFYSITPENEATIYEINKSFGQDSANRNLTDALAEILGMDDRFWPFMSSGVVLHPWPTRTGGPGGGYAQCGMGLGPGFYLSVVDFEQVITRGCRSIIDEAKQYLKDLRYFSSDSIDKKHYWEAVVMVFEAIVTFANRYADLAEKMAAEEKNPRRQKELLQIAEHCRRVPEYPARTFREGVQSFWFAWLLENPCPTAGIGRWDQYMYPLYRQDLEAGRITPDEALELIENIRMKDMRMHRESGKLTRRSTSGLAKWHNMTLGGVKSDGTDATNELTYLCLKAAEETVTPHNTVTLRVHEGTPPELLLAALKVVQTGIGMPAFVGDKNYIRYFMENNCSLEDARDYCMAGCVDGVIPAKTRTEVVTFFVIPQVMDITLHNGFCRFNKMMVGIETGDVTKMDTFEEFEAAFYKQLKYLLTMAQERNNVEMISVRKLFPDIFRSVLIKDGISSGTEHLARNMQPFDAGSMMCTVGGVNAGDSLAAIKKLVYMDKKYTMAQLLEALDADWNGFEDMQKDFLDAPKFGNNDDFPDQFVKEIYGFYSDTLHELDTPYGGKGLSNAISISAHQPGGACVGASPDGRKGGTILADASMSPMHGCDKCGPLAAFQSAMKVDQWKYQATLMNMKFHPTALKTDEDLNKLGAVIKTYLTNGGSHIQFNVVKTEEMLDAKIHPEDHEDLIVRVAGYSAYFVQLGEAIQDEVINRTSYDSI